MTAHIVTVRAAETRLEMEVERAAGRHLHKATCPYCHAAKALLRRKGAAFDEVGVDGDRAAQAAMAEKANGRSTVPQIFIGDAPCRRLRRPL